MKNRSEKENSLKKRIKAAAGIMMLLVLTACMGKETQPNPNLEYEGVITQQVATDSTFPHMEETKEENTEQEAESGDEVDETQDTDFEDDFEDKTSEETEEETQEEAPTKTYRYVTADILNIRNAASVQAELAGHAAYGEALEITGQEENGFLQICLKDGSVAYASASYLSETEPEGAKEAWYAFSDMPVVDTAKALYTYEEMAADIKELAARFPDHVRAEVAGQTEDGRDLYVVTLGNPNAEQYVVMHASIHAREYMTTLLVMKQLEYYATYYHTNSYYDAKSNKDILFAELFDNVAFVIMPMVNPDGVTISQLGADALQTEHCKEAVQSFYEKEGAGRTAEAFYARFKANAVGVDLNRNFSYGWEEFVGSSIPASERYKGEAPGSEAETKVLMALTGEKQAAGISYHATGSILYWDFGQSGTLRERCLELTNLVHNLTGYTIQYASNNKQDEAGYCEWLVGVMGIPEVTIEIGTQAAPLKIAEFASIWAKNKDVPAAVAALYRKTEH